MDKSFFVEEGGCMPPVYITIEYQLDLDEHKSPVTRTLEEWAWRANVFVEVKEEFTQHDMIDVFEWLCSDGWSITGVSLTPPPGSR